MPNPDDIIRWQGDGVADEDKEILLKRMIEGEAHAPFYLEDLPWLSYLLEIYSLKPFNHTLLLKVSISKINS